MTPLPSLRTGLRRHQLDGQLLVFDAQADQVHLLDGTTAAVVEMLDQGVSSDAIAERLGAEEGTAAGATLLALALDQLAEARLVAASASAVAPIMETTRRQMIQRVAGLGAALMVPAIVTLTPRRAYAGTGQTNGTTCSASTQCASRCCKTNGGLGSGRNTCVTQGTGDTCASP